MPGNVFISYRRDDAAAWAGRLHMALEKHFRRDQLFMDVDSIQAGLDFAKVIDVEVAKCDVMLVVIGKGWLDARDAAGRRRLDDPGDFVRLEVESALRRDIRVVPVLVDGASLPKAQDLPEDMQGLVRRQAVILRHEQFSSDLNVLVGEIGRRIRPRAKSDEELAMGIGGLFVAYFRGLLYAGLIVGLLSLVFVWAIAWLAGS